MPIIKLAILSVFLLVQNSLCGQDLLASWSFDSSTGTNFNDGTGHGYTIVSTNLGLTDGVKGKALNCIGTSYKPVVLNSLNNFSAPQFSIEAWIYSYIDLVNPGSFLNYKTIISYQTWASGLAEGYSLEITDQGVIQATLSQAINPGSWIGCYSDSIIKPRTWYHVVFTYDGNTMCVYLNNRLAGKQAYAGGYIPPHQNAYIGVQVGTDNSLRNWFNGKIDEMKIYNYALSTTEIAKSYNSVTVSSTPQFKINLGMKQAYGNPGDTIEMPIYLTNFEDYKISSCQFALHFDTSIVKLVSVSKDSGIAKNWSVIANADKIDPVPVAMGGLATSIAYGEGELIRGTFVINKNAIQGKSSTIDLQDISIDENKFITPTSVSGKINVLKPTVLFGDVTGNGEVTSLDAARILEFIVGKVVLPDTQCCSNFTKTVADVTGDGTISSYDAALIFQYSVGMFTNFPIQNKTIQKKLSTKAITDSVAQLTLSSPFNIGTDIYQYTLHAKNIQGFIAGQFVLQCNPSVIATIKDISPKIRNANLRAQYDNSQQCYSAALTTNDQIDSTDLDLFVVTVQQKPGIIESGMSIKNALVNEGKIPATFVSIPVKSNRSLQMPSTSPQIEVFKSQIVLRNFPKKSVTVQLYDILGRLIFKNDFSNSPILILDKKLFKTGLYLFKITSGNDTHTAKIPITGR